MIIYFSFVGFGLTLSILGPYSMGIGNAAAWLGMPVIAPEKFEDIATKLENQDHAAQLPPDTDLTVIAGMPSDTLHSRKKEGIGCLILTVQLRIYCADERNGSIDPLLKHGLLVGGFL